ncbi:MAG: hypothetical protein JEY71_09880 [Sphaerochaeta sp.]|nr:hypothetical protein [Sphaerochaeta sp.]
MDNSPKMEAAVDAVFEMLSQWSDEKFFSELQGSYDGEFAHLLKDMGTCDLDLSFELESVEHVEQIETITNYVSDCLVSINYKDEDSKIYYKNFDFQWLNTREQDDEISCNIILEEGPSSWMTRIA